MKEAEMDELLFDTEWTDFPKCPYCGKEDQDWWDGLEPKEDGDIWDVVCSFCEREYRTTMSVSTHFTTTSIQQETLPDAG